MKSNRMLKCLMLTLTISLFYGSCISYGQEENKKAVIGKWNGVINAMGTSIHMVVVVEEKDGKLTGKADSPDQQVYGIPVDSINITGDSIEVMMNSVTGVFKGKFDLTKNLIKGAWYQGGGEFPLELKKEIEAEKSQPEIQYTSYWQGKLTFGNSTLPLVLKLYKNEDGTTSGHVDSPNQNVQNMVVKKIEFSGDSIHFNVESIGGSYAGAMEKDSPVVKGKWTQGGMSLPLDLRKTDKVVGPNRPQTPQQPYPYNDEEVVFENKTAGITLAGSFTFPKGEGKYPAVVLVTGSGPQDRDESLLNHKPFLIIADYLTRNGIAVLRFDDRGTAKSKGSFATATSTDFATDALAAVEYLKTRKEVDVKKIGVAGHSEGGIIAPMCAVNSNDVSFIVMLAGPGVPGKDIILLQSELIMRAEGMKEEDIQKAHKQNARIYKVLAEQSDSLEMFNKILALYNDDISKMSDDEKKKPENSKEMFNQQVKTLLSPWFRFFIKYDPRPTLEEVTVPVLALNGAKDLQVPPKQNLPEIEKALKAAGNKNFKTIEMPGLNHLFQPAKTGAPSEYATIETTFSEDALKIMKDWILEITK